MSPSFKLNFFMNPFGMGCCMPTLPFFGGMRGFMPSVFSSFVMPMPNFDTLSFMNNPVYRNTSYDFLLDPNLALSKVQQQWAAGGGCNGGMSMLPGYQFPSVQWPQMPQMPQMQWPWMPKTETAEEKKAREEKEKKKKEQEAKPEYKQAKALETLFTKVKEISANENNDLTKITKEQEDAVKDAMKKEDAVEMYNAMKAVFEDIDASAIRKAVLDNATIREELRKAGYNFNLNNNKYAIPNKDIANSTFEQKEFSHKLKDEIAQGKFDNNVMQLTGNLEGQNNGKFVLNFISTWNDEHHGNGERGYLRFLASHLPSKDDAIHMQMCVNNVEKVVSAICTKAKGKEYNGCQDIEALAKELTNLKNDCCKVTYNSETGTSSYNQFNAGKINDIADKFDKLYVLLRMQDAVRINSDIMKNESFSFLNAVKADVINDDIVIKETIEDLKAEGFSDGEIPEIKTLPKPQKTPAERAEEERRIQEEEQTLDTPEKKRDYLVKNGIIEKVSEDEDVYKIKDLDANSNLAKFFMIVNNKFVEVKSNDEYEIEQVEENPDDSKIVSEITTYKKTVEQINRLIDENVIEPYKYTDSNGQVYIFTKLKIYKATGDNQFFIVKDNKLCLIKNCNKIVRKSETTVDGKTEEYTYVIGNGLDKKVIDLTADDLDTNFNEENIQSTKKIEQDKKKKEEADIVIVENYTFESLKDAKTGKKLSELSKAIKQAENPNIDIKDGEYDKRDFIQIKVNGYFYCKSKNRYYRYDENENKLKYQKDVQRIDECGYMKYKNGTIKECEEVISDTISTDENGLKTAINDYGQKFAKAVNGKSSSEDDSIAFRALNTIIAKNNPLYTVNFIKGYKDYDGFWLTRICRQIVSENGFEDGDNVETINSKKRYMKEIVKLILDVISETSYNNSVVIAQLEKIACGEYEYKSHNLDCTINFKNSDNKEISIKLDDIIDDVIEAYDDTKA